MVRSTMPVAGANLRGLKMKRLLSGISPFPTDSLARQPPFRNLWVKADERKCSFL